MILTTRCPALPPASRQWNFAMADGDLFKGGFGGQGLYVSPARDLVIAFAGTPRQDGSANLLRWFSRRLAVTISRRLAEETTLKARITRSHPES